MITRCPAGLAVTAANAKKTAQPAANAANSRRWRRTKRSGRFILGPYVRTARSASGCPQAGQLPDASFAVLGLLAGVEDEPEPLLDELEESDELDEPVEALVLEPLPDLERLSVR
jgi:hypothetical protein